MVKQAGFAVIALALCATPSLGQAQGLGQTQGSAAATAPAAVSAAPASATDAASPAVDYRIGPSDVLGIDVFEVKDLDRTAQVDANGNVKFPLIGLVPAAGRTTAQLADEIRSRLEAKYLNHASVTVQVKTSQSEKVTVDGAVQSPGVYPIRGHVTLIQAVAMAKGLDPENANAHKVTVFRTVNAHWTSTRYDLARIRHGEADDPVLQARDVVVVASAKKHAVLTNLANILPFVLLIPAL